MSLIVGISGFIGSGKDTAADYLVNHYDFHRDSFASALKDVCAAVFGWDRILIEGRDEGAREWRNQVDKWWAEKLNIPHFTPRYALQNIGTNLFREYFNNDIWILSLANKLRKTTSNTVITDCRYPNEIAAIREHKGIMIRVVRGYEPEWYFTAQAALNGDSMAQVRMEQEFSIHTSEWAWINSKFDYIVYNNGTITDLYDQVNSIVKHHLELNRPAST